MGKELEKYQLTIKGEKIPREILKEYYAADKWQRDVIYDERAIDNSKKIGKRFTKARNKKGWSIEMLASKTEIPLLVIQDVEDGNPLIAVHILMCLIDQLGMEISALFKGLNRKKEGTNTLKKRSS